MEKKSISTSERIAEILKYAIVNKHVADKGEFAAMLGVNPSTISRYLSGKKIPPESSLRKFNAAFGNIFSDQWLLLGVGEMLNGNQPADAIALNVHAPVYQNTGNGGNHVTQNDVNGELLSIIHKRDEQIDRLLTIIENMKQ